MKNSTFGIQLKAKISRVSIRYKIFMSFIIIIIVVIAIINIVSSFTYINVLNEKTIKMSSELVEISEKYVNLKSSQFEELVFSCISMENVNAFLRNNYKNPMIQISPKEIWKLEETLNRCIASNSEVKKIYLVSQNGTTLHKKRNEALLTINDLENDEIITLNNVIQLMDSSRDDNIWTNLNNTQESVFYIKKIVDMKSLDKIGYFICELSIDYFDFDLDSSSILDVNLTILNQFYEVIHTKMKDKKGIVDFIIQNEVQGKNRVTGSVQYDGIYIFMYERAAYSDWQIICVVPTNDIFKGSKIISEYILLVGFFCVIFAMVVSYIVSSKITANLRLLEENMDKIENENFSVCIRPVTYDETGMLALRFNYMANKISELIKTVTEQSELQQRISFEVMQTKINPHFLYNTLGSIQWMAHSNQQLDIERMTQALIELLKAGLNKNGDVCTIADELEYIENYILLQRMRYGDRFEIMYDICEESETLVILPFLIQPIVENAIYHGYDMKKENFQINIKTQINKDFLLIQICDNGVGIDDVTKELIFKKETLKSKSFTNFNSIGIKSVHERIRFYFGMEYGVTIESEIGVGTSVLIKLPVKREKGEIYD